LLTQVVVSLRDVLKLLGPLQNIKRFDNHRRAANIAAPTGMIEAFSDFAAGIFIPIVILSLSFFENGYIL
jgi:hypothetical protein